MILGVGFEREIMGVRWDLVMGVKTLSLCVFVGMYVNVLCVDRQSLVGWMPRAIGVGPQGVLRCWIGRRVCLGDSRIPGVLVFSICRRWLRGVGGRVW